MPTWWVPFRMPGGGSPTPTPPTGSNVAAPAKPAVPAFAFVPVMFTNRPKGPLVGPAGQIVSSSPGGTSQALGQAKTAVGYVGTAVQLAQQLTVQVVQGVGTIIGAVAGALGMAQAVTMDAKTGVARVVKEDAINSAAFSVASSAAAIAATAVSVATGALTAGLLLPIAAFFTASSINDSNNAVIRAKQEVKDLGAAGAMLSDSAPKIASCSDRIDEIHMLPRVTDRNLIIKWCSDNYLLACYAIFQSGQLSWAYDHIANGENMAGIPGRDITGIQSMINQGVRDAVLLYLATRDILARMGAAIPQGPVQVVMAGRTRAAQGFSASVDPATLIQILANTSGFPNEPGLIPNATVSVNPNQSSYLVLNPPAVSLNADQMDRYVTLINQGVAPRDAAPLAADIPPVPQFVTPDGGGGA
jgi:hypothetical protein